MSYDLEDIFTDTFISVIEHEQLVPYFESNMVGEGVEATVELLARRAYEKVRSQAYDPLEARPDVGRYRAGGAGVETEVDLGNLERGPPAVAEPGERLSRRLPRTPANARRGLGALSRNQPSSHQGYFSWTLRRSHAGPFATASQHRRGPKASGQSVRRPFAHDSTARGSRGDFFLDDLDHLRAPWFFHRGVDGWQLDGSVLPNVIVYNHRNQWRFKSLDTPTCLPSTTTSSINMGLRRRQINKLQ